MSANDPKRKQSIRERTLTTIRFSEAAGARSGQLILLARPVASLVSFCLSALVFNTCILRWQFGHRATVFAIASSPPCASQII